MQASLSLDLLHSSQLPRGGKRLKVKGKRKIQSPSLSPSLEKLGVSWGNPVCKNTPTFRKNTPTFRFPFSQLLQEV